MSGRNERVPTSGRRRDTMCLRVVETRRLCTDVREVVFASADGVALPSFTPGSNLPVEWSPGRRNSYSLTGPSVEPDRYSISVRLDPSGSGGSRWIHDLAVGEVVDAGHPRSAFAPVLTARHHVFVAGGIGVTPILSHVRAALDWNRSFEVFYSFRAGYGAHIEQMRDLCGERLTAASSASELRALLTASLADQRLGTHLYSCGPLPMIDTVAELARAAGWPAQRVHSEAFGAGPRAPGRPFAAKLGRSGMLVPVETDVSLLEALLDKGIDVPNLCRQGVCGECRLSVRGGQLDHRDLFLTEQEKAAGDSIMPCVSRSVGDLLELEL